jgi:hemoglobin
MNRFVLISLSLAAVMLGVSFGRAARADDGSLYHDLGEEPGITRIVDFAIEQYVTDPRVKDQFDNINFDWLKPRLVQMFCEYSGGPCHYKGRDMRSSHVGLHIGTAEFNAFVEDLQIAMDKAGIAFSTQNRLLAIFAPMYHDVVTR